MGYWNSLNPPEFYEEEDERLDIKTAYKELRAYSDDISNKLYDIIDAIEEMKSLFSNWEELRHCGQPSVLADDEDNRVHNQLEDEVYEFAEKVGALGAWMDHTRTFEP